MKVAAIKCPVCEAVVWSRTRHDLKYCDCGKCHIGGGRAYTKYGAVVGVTPVVGVYNTSLEVFSTEGEGDYYQ
jgi:hypothetical protein